METAIFLPTVYTNMMIVEGFCQISVPASSNADTGCIASHCIAARGPEVNSVHEDSLSPNTSHSKPNALDYSANPIRSGTIIDC